MILSICFFLEMCIRDRRNSWDADRFPENGSYFRLKNISIGYNLKKEWFKNLGIDKLRFYATGSNLLTLTGYSGLDPDFINTNIWNSGTDSFYLPYVEVVEPAWLREEIIESLGKNKYTK